MLSQRRHVSTVSTGLTGVQTIEPKVHQCLIKCFLPLHHRGTIAAAISSEWLIILIVLTMVGRNELNVTVKRRRDIVPQRIGSGRSNDTR